MPNRLIREDILTSERIDKLDAFSEVFYRRLMSRVDDHGLYDARPSILRSSLYPLRVDRIREADIARSLTACEGAGVIALYQHDGKPYLRMLDTRWEVRSKPKFPAPPALANNCAQVQTIAGLDGDGDGDVVDKRKEPTALVERGASDGLPYVVPDCPYDGLLGLYHERLPMLARVARMSDARRKTTRQRWVEVCAESKFDAAQGLEFFGWYFDRVKDSPFLLGRSPGRQGGDDRVFKADFEWLMKSANFVKVFEGKYLDKKSP